MKKRLYQPIKGWHLVMMVLGFVASGFSWKWTFNVLSSLFDPLTGGLIATMLTILEIYGLMQLILTWNPAWLLAVIPGFAMSIMGSYGNFQMDYETNVAKSDEYQSKQNEIRVYEEERDKLLTAAQGYDDTKQPWYANPKRKAAKEVQDKIDASRSELKNMTDQGYGASNALFRSIARHSELSALDAAEQGNLALGIVLEVFMLVCTGISASAMKKGYAWVRPNENDYYVSYGDEGIPEYGKNPVGFQHPPVEVSEPEKKTPLVRGTGETSSNGNGDKFKEMNQRSIESRNETKAQKKRALKKFVADNPNATQSEMAAAIKVSLGTLRKYLEEMGYWSR